MAIRIDLIESRLALAAGTWGPLLVLSFRGTPGVDDIKLSLAASGVLQKRYPDGMATVTIAGVHGIGLPDAETRKFAIEAMKAEAQHHRNRRVILVEGEDLWASSIRTMLGSMRLLAKVRGGQDTRIERTFEGAATAIGPHVGAESTALMGELAAAMRTFRGRHLPLERRLSS
jgi:hypothetical protein